MEDGWAIVCSAPSTDLRAVWLFEPCDAEDHFATSFLGTMYPAALDGDGGMYCGDEYYDFISESCLLSLAREYEYEWRRPYSPPRTISPRSPSSSDEESIPWLRYTMFGSVIILPLQSPVHSDDDDDVLSEDM